MKNKSLVIFWTAFFMIGFLYGSSIEIKAQTAKNTVSKKTVKRKPVARKKISPQSVRNSSGFVTGSSPAFAVRSNDSPIEVESKTEPDAKGLSYGILNGKATGLVVPDYPPSAKSVHAAGAVNVR